MKRLIVVIAIVALAGSYAGAVERKSVRDVSPEAFTLDAQVTAQGAGDDHVTLVRWAPLEYWESVLIRDPKVKASQRAAVLRPLSGMSILMVVQADVGEGGRLDFYPEQEVSANMGVTFIDAEGQEHAVRRIDDLNRDRKAFLDAVRPVLVNSIGRMGENLHFFVISDREGAFGRMVDPYEKGALVVELARRDGQTMTARIETPLNCLFVPRKCPNGKDAHVSWKFCPWTGQKLPE